MDQQTTNHPVAGNRTSVERKGDRELVVTRTFDAPPRIVFKVWSDPDLFRRWWVPKGAPMTLQECDMDVRTGGKYRLEFSTGGAEAIAFYGQDLDGFPNQAIGWTHDQGEEGAVATVTFEDQGGSTLVTFHEAYPSKEALEEALQGSAVGLPEQLDQLEKLLSE